MEVHGEEGEFTSKMARLGEETMDLEHKVQDLVAQLHDMKSSFQEEQKLVPLKERLQCLEKKIEKKKIEANAIISLGACQTIVDDVMFSFPKSTSEMPYLEI